MSFVEIRSRVALALIEAAVAGRDLPTLFATFCDSLHEAGVPLARAAVGALLVHPLLDATLVIWRHGQGALVEDTPRPLSRGQEVWRTSPFYRLLTSGEASLRLRLDRGEGHEEFPLLARLAAEGATDYLARRLRLGATVSLGEPEDLYSSWLCDRPGGFTDEHLSLLGDLEPLAAFIFTSALNVSSARALLAAYLGADAARRVLGGAIGRAGTDTIRAVVWYSDLQGFTHLADTLPPVGTLELLNGYTEALVAAIEASTGQVLKFMGDGILAIFRTDAGDACEAALAAWAEALRLTAAVSTLRRARGLPVTHPYLALHVGEVLYGNIGGRTRLDFTVLGPAVNEAARIAALCRSLEQPAILSEAFAEACAVTTQPRLARLGRYALRGVSRPQMLFALAPDDA